MTGHNHKTGLLVPSERGHYSIQFVVKNSPLSWMWIVWRKVISCFRNRINHVLFWSEGENSVDSWPLSSFCTHNDVKTPSVAVVVTERMFHQSRCQMGKKWQVAHISPARAKWASKWDKAADKSDTYRGDSFSHLGIMVLIGVLLFHCCRLRQRPKKVCDKIHN